MLRFSEKFPEYPGYYWWYSKEQTIRIIIISEHTVKDTLTDEQTSKALWQTFSKGKFAGPLMPPTL